MEFGNKAQKLFPRYSTAVFVANAILAELIGVKIFALEDTLGVQPFNWNLYRAERFAELHRRHPALAGRVRDDRHHQRILRPPRRTHDLVAGGVPDHLCVPVRVRGDRARAGRLVGHGRRRRTACPTCRPRSPRSSARGCGRSPARSPHSSIGQLVDVGVFHAIRKRTGGRHIWLRATGSTLVSQAVRQPDRALHRVRDRSAAMVRSVSGSRSRR